MTNPPFVKVGCAIVGMLALVIGVVVGLLIATRQPTPTIPELLAGYEPSERQALEALCAAAQIEPTQLRPLRIWAWDLTKQPLAISADDRRHVRALRISGRGLTDLRPIAALKGLRTLWLDGNKLTKLEGLEDLQDLAELNLRGNALTAVAALPPNLLVLDIGENQVATLDGISWPSRCAQLFAARNALTSLDFLQHAPALAEVDLDHNAVTSLDPLLALKKTALVHLYLRHNRVAALPSAKPALPDLKVWLEGNPVAPAEKTWP